MTPQTIGAVLGELVGVVIDAIGRSDEQRREVILAELAELVARVRRLAPLGSAVHAAAERRRAELTDEDGA